MREYSQNQHLCRKGTEIGQGRGRNWAAGQSQQGFSQPHEELFSWEDPSELSFIVVRGPGLYFPIYQITGHRLPQGGSMTLNNACFFS